MLQHDTKQLIQRPCYQRGSPWQDPAGNRTTRRPPGHHEETCLPFITSGQNHLAWHYERGKKIGRQWKRWQDNIREWTGLEFAKSQRAVENRKTWRKLLVKSSVAAQRPLRLRDRWWRWWRGKTAAADFLFLFRSKTRFYKCSLEYAHAFCKLWPLLLSETTVTELFWK